MTAPVPPWVHGDNDTDWDVVRRCLGIPLSWTIHPKRREDDWVLAAQGGAPLKCGHRSMRVTANSLPEGVALMAARLRFHERWCS